MAFKEQLVKSLKSLTPSSWWGGIAPVAIPTNPAIEFFSYNGEIEWTKCHDAASLRWLYQHCAPLSAIISQKAEAFATGKLEVLSATTGNFARGEQKKWDKLFDQPNILQSKKQFLKQVYSYMQLYGFTIVLKNYPAGFKDVPYSMWVVPYEMLYFEPINKPFYLITKDELVNRIYIDWNGTRVKLDPENIMFLSDSSALIDANTLLPQSRVISLQKPISIIMSSLEAELTLIQKRGAIGILSNKTTDINGTQPLTKPEKEQIQNDFQRTYGLQRGAAQYIITSANLEWQSMTYPTRELMLHESYIKAYKDLVDAYGYEWALTAHSDQSTYNNVKTASLNLYQNTIIPEADNIAEQLVRGLNAEEQGVVFEFSYEHNPVFNQTEKERGEGKRALNDALQVEWTNGLITLNDWREELEEDTVNLPEFNMYKPEYDNYIKSQYGSTEPVNNIPDGNQA